MLPGGCDRVRDKLSTTFNGSRGQEASHCRVEPPLLLGHGKHHMTAQARTGSGEGVPENVSIASCTASSSLADVCGGSVTSPVTRQVTLPPGLDSIAPVEMLLASSSAHVMGKSTVAVVAHKKESLSACGWEQVRVLAVTRAAEATTVAVVFSEATTTVSAVLVAPLGNHVANAVPLT